MVFLLSGRASPGAANAPALPVVPFLIVGDAAGCLSLSLVWDVSQIS
jgi:hypothetical protein